MKTLIVSTFDIAGGSGRAAYRLHQGLQILGTTSQMLVQYKTSDDYNVFLPPGKMDKWVARFRANIDDIPLKIYPNDKYPAGGFSLQWTGKKLISTLKKIAPDVINLHWAIDFTRMETLVGFSRPIVWTLHDMWAFTGGCHYSLECDRYLGCCGNCPQLNSTKSHDLSNWVWQRKAKSWQGIPLTVVTPSKWLAQQAKASSLFRNTPVEVIPNGLDTKIYKPFNRGIARQWLNLPQDKRLILFGALSPTDARKGYQYLEPTLEKIAISKDCGDMELVVFGTSQPNASRNCKIKTHYIGSFKDDISLALLYAAADVFIAPSIQDNLPNTVMEALACGTPCVAFDIGGMPDMIEHQKNGFLAKPFESDSLANGIIWVLEDGSRYQRLCDNARQKVEQEFTQEIQANRYTQLFSKLLMNRENHGKQFILSHS
jgi:glycosyltransferase involved in cell wall biosynthesis